MTKFVILDGNAILHRAFHALPPLTSKTGEEMQGVYGFLLVLTRVFKELSPTHMACAFDVKAPTFRHELSDAYKAQRAATPPSLVPQIQYARDAMNAFGIPVCSREGFEADDVIATLTHKALQKKNCMQDIVIVTGDTDLLQLVRPSVSVYLLKRGVKNIILYTEQLVKETYGLSPRQLVDVKSLKGDPTDNIRGVPGIGEKGALDLVQRFSTIEQILKEAEKTSSGMSERMKQILIQHKDEALHAKRLVEVREDVPLDCDIRECELSEFPKEQASAFLEKLGFASFQKKINEIERYYGRGYQNHQDRERTNATLWSL